MPAPFEYFPMEDFRRQMEVNFMGYVQTTQAFLPMIKETVMKPGSRRGRIVFTSSGPIPGPSPPLISAYMASKWAGEAFCQSIRMELKLRQIPIDCSMLSPGVVKPTRLAEEGQKMIERMWTKMPAVAKDEYEPLLNAFQKFQIEQPGTHVKYVGYEMEKAMTDGVAKLRYFVGFDSRAAIVVGLLPTFAREWLLRNTLMMHYSGAPKLGFS